MGLLPDDKAQLLTIRVSNLTAAQQYPGAPCRKQLNEIKLIPTHIQRFGIQYGTTIQRYNIMISRSQVEHNVPQIKCQVPAASVSWKMEEK